MPIQSFVFKRIRCKEDGKNPSKEINKNISEFLNKMINLTNEILIDGKNSLLDKFWTLTQPIVYFAENMGDFSKNCAQIEIPFHQKFLSLFDKSAYEAWILVHGVTIRQYQDSEVYTVRDETGEKLMYWKNVEENIRADFTNREIGVLFGYLLESDLRFILAVTEKKSPRIYPRKPRKKEIERVPIFEPIIQPSY